ncbi:MAG: hypothetical protein Q9200_007688, partial [Gallowayella weberi]
FDDLPMTTFLSAAPIPGPQDGLLFGGINYKSDFVTGIDATSPPNAIAFGELGRLVGTSSADKNITSKYTGSKVKSFRLTSIFLACCTTATGAVPPVAGGTRPNIVTIAEPCQVQFDGVTSKGAPKSALCSYSGTLLDPDMQKCFFDSEEFADLVTVHLSVADAFPVSNATSVLMDNVAHTNYY